MHIFTCALVLVQFIILSSTCLDSSPLQKCWIDLLYALANKPEGVVHVVIFRAGLSQVPLEVTNFIQRYGICTIDITNILEIHNSTQLQFKRSTLK